MILDLKQIVNKYSYYKVNYIRGMGCFGDSKSSEVKGSWIGILAPFGNRHNWRYVIFIKLIKKPKITKFSFRKNCTDNDYYFGCGGVKKKTHELGGIIFFNFFSLGQNIK